MTNLLKSRLSHSGGILLIWDLIVFQKELVLSGANYSGVVGRWHGINEKVALVNVYGPQQSSQKKALWIELHSLISSRNAIWIIFRDFNAVRFPKERVGCSFSISEATTFNDFIVKSGLLDFQMGNHRFTRFDREGAKMSKLDRFLVSQKFFNFWNNASVSALPRTLFDHCPVMLSVGMKHNGPKAFNIFDHWFTVHGFDSLVNKSWSEGLYNGTPDIILKNKLKKLKADIKEWNYFKCVESNRWKEDLKKRIFEWDQKAELDALSPNDVDAREEILMELMHLEQNDRNSLKQKSRVKWAIKGDENTKKFHTLVNKKARKQAVNGLIWNGSWTEDIDIIKNAAFYHYQDRFKKSTHQRPKFRSSLFRKLKAAGTTFLEASISMDEIKDAVWSCSGSKLPGHDGINFNFLRRYWELLKHDVFNAIKHFETSGILARGCNPSFIVLVPKINDPLQMSDYRLISLIGCLYKIILKILSSRLAKVIHKLISANQTTFLAGRQILDRCLIANEIINCAKSEDSRLLLFKVGFEKAFDSVNWAFLHDIMQQMGFSVKWRKWVNKCMNSASVFVLVNGSPSREFKFERGLSLAEDGANISLLQYVDDALFFGEWSYSNTSTLVKMHKCFQDVSGLKVNLLKSRLYGVGVSLNEVASVAEVINCAHDKLPFTYLGLPVGRNMRIGESWNMVVDRFLNRLSSWKSKLMSIGDRLTLVKAVLGSMPLYYLSMFRSPIKIIKRLEAIRSRFFRVLMMKVERWVPIRCRAVSQFASLKNQIGRSQGAVRALYGVSYMLLWSIWRWHNKLLHASLTEVDGIKHEDIFPSIQRLFLLWMSIRSGRDNMNWRDWSLNPCEIIDI
ncbi:putative RNA-directed DNA polymerase [Tanacetum coccineum]